MNPRNLRQTLRAPLGDSDTGGGAAGTTGTLSQAKQTIQNTARDTTARIKSAAGETVSRAKSEAQRVAAEKKDQTADRLGGYGSALHESAESFEPHDPNIAWAAHRLADRIDRAADYVRRSDFATVRSDVEDIARRHPAVFFGGLFLAGVLVGNLLKARPIGQSSYEDETDWDEGNASGATESPETPDGSGV